MNKTLTYYKNTSSEYIDSTKNVDMSASYQVFEKYLKKNDRVLDLGFGSGRDSLYLSNKYNVVSIDPVEEFVENAKNLGLDARLMSAEEMNFENEFDGIWACASLLHVEEEKLAKCFENCYKALNDDGTMYCSFKYGDFVGYQGDRYFVYLTEDTIKNYIGKFKIVETYITGDKLANRDLRWLNVILVK